MTQVSRRFVLLRSLGCALALVACIVSAQSAKPAATITFTLDFPQSAPDHYQLVISSDGRASYDSTGKLTPDSDPGDPFQYSFTMSPDTVSRIFALAAKAKYFEGKVDSGKTNLANTGTKVLSYKDDQRSHQATYNYSPIPAVQQLTALLQNISTTLEFGRRLDYYHHYQKLALDEELKAMEEMASSKSLEEVQAVTPILQRIAADTSVINITRARARRLLAENHTAATR